MRETTELSAVASWVCCLAVRAIANLFMSAPLRKGEVRPAESRPFIRGDNLDSILSRVEVDVTSSSSMSSSLDGVGDL